jgi:hypothetical protein
MICGVVIVTMVMSCSEEEAAKTCTLQRLNVNPLSYHLIDYNADGTIAAVTLNFPGGKFEQFDYLYTSNKISIYKTTVEIASELAFEVGLDLQGLPSYRKQGNTVQERYIYDATGKLDHIMRANKDSIVFTYNEKNKNPEKSEFFQYNKTSKAWSKLNTITYTFNKKPNFFKGLIMPIENWDINLFFYETNLTSYTDNGDTYNLSYTYNVDGLPISRTLTSKWYTESWSFGYDCD